MMAETENSLLLRWLYRSGVMLGSGGRWRASWSMPTIRYLLLPLVCLLFNAQWVTNSAVKRYKYLIAINHIYVIVNSKLIAINRKFVSILNVPSFIYFFHHFIFILMPLSTWKSGLACFKQMFYLIENQHCQTGRYKIKL